MKNKFLMICSSLPSVLNFRGKLLEAIHQQGYEIHIIAPDLPSFPTEHEKLLDLGYFIILLLCIFLFILLETYFLKILISIFIKYFILYFFFI